MKLISAQYQAMDLHHKNAIISIEMELAPTFSICHVYCRGYSLSLSIDQIELLKKDSEESYEYGSLKDFLFECNLPHSFSEKTEFLENIIRLF